MFIGSAPGGIAIAKPALELEAPLLSPDERPPRIALVALDVDGTLLRSDKRLSMRAVQTIQAVTRRGVRVVLASARPPRSVREIYNHLELDTLQVNYNGALIHDLPRNRHVYHQPLSADLARQVIRVARRVDRRVVISIEILDKWYTDHVDETLPTETSRAFMPDFIGPLDAFLSVPVTKLMLLAPPEKLTRIADAVRKRFKDRIATAVSDKHLLQVMHPKVDKAHALARIAGTYGIAREAVLAIGDAPNDVGMLRWAGLGIAVENAWDHTRKAARHIVPSNDADGVAHALRKFVLEA